MAGTDIQWWYGETLKQCKPDLMHGLSIRSLVEKLTIHMVSEEHITLRQSDDITETNLTSEKLERLLAILIGKSDAASYGCVVRVLNENGCEHIVDTINNRMEKVKMLSQPPEESVHEMVERIKLNPMDVPPSEMIRCFTIMAKRLNQAVTQDGGATSSDQHHAATLSTKDDDKIQEEAFNRFMKACESGNTDEVKHLLTQHPTYVNGTNENSETPLMVGSRHNNLDIVIELLRSDLIDVNMRDDNGRTALMHSVLGGGCEVITLLLNTERVDVNICDNDGMKYHWYIFGMDAVLYLSILPQLPEKAKDAVKILAIHETYFIKYFDKIKELQNDIDKLENIPKVVQCLIANNHVNETDILMSCLAIGTPDLVLTVLKSQKCIIDKRDITDYAYAIGSSVNPRVVDVLIEHGLIKLDQLTTVEMDTLVESVIRYNCPKLCARMTKLMRSFSVNEALRTVLTLQATPVDIWLTMFDKGFDINLKDGAGNSILYLLCKYGTYEAVAEVVQWTNIDFTLRNNHGQTCYMLSLLNCDTNVAKLLLDSENVKVGINDSDNFLTSTLDYACQNDNIEAVKYLIASPMIDVNTQNIDGKTALMNVCLENFSILGILFLGKSTSIIEYVKLSQKITRMPSFLSKNNMEIVTILLDSDKNDLSLKSPVGIPVLAFACVGGNATVVSKLIEKGVNVNDTRQNSITALMDASYFATCEIVSLLLSANANINAVTEHGETALNIACLVENTEIVRLLLRQNAAVDIVANGGYTALHFACLVKNIAIVDLLLAADADVHKATNNGNTALHIAVGLDSSDKDIPCAQQEERAFWISKQVPSPSIVRALLRAKTDINATTPDGVTVLMSACERKNAEIVRILVTAGADLNKTDCRGNTALTISCRPGNESVLKELLSANNLEINALNQRGFSALSEACFANLPKTVALLLEHNANRNLIINGEPLLKMVEDKGYTEIANMMKNMP